MSVWYLELDDEITDAVARLRAAKDERVVLVVPPGSRIGTGRINFRLLAREAETRGLGLALVSGDAQVRALAASAGLAVFATVSDSEAVETGGAPASTGAASDATTATGPALLVATATLSTAPGPGPGGATTVALPDSRTRRADTDRKPTIARRPRSRRVKVMAAGLAVLTLAGGGGIYGAYVTIPRATVTLTQLAHAIEPATLALTVDADLPTDPAAGVIQGTRTQIPISVPGTVIASGSAPTPVTERAKGVVTFTNHSPNPIPIPDETVVGTPDRVNFETQGGIIVPPGASMDVEVRAVQGGDDGNVDASTITQMPDVLRATLNSGTVTNKEATSGGTSSVPPVILDADYDRTLLVLTTQLNEELQRQSAAPPGLPPDAIAYPATVQAGVVTTVPPRELVVGQPVATQDISAVMAGSVLTASGSEIERVATAMLTAAVAEGNTLVPGSIVVTPGEPTITDEGRVTYAATASGRAYDQELNKAQVKDDIKGKPKSVAQEILDRLGKATITLSPDWMPTLPDDPSRIDLIITPFGGAAP